MARRHKISSLIACSLFVWLLATGCATTTHSIDYTKSELRLIPGSSLQRIALAHAEDEIVAVRVDGRDKPVEVKEFKNRDYVTIHTADGKEEEVRFSNIKALLISRKPKTQKKVASQKGASASAITSATVEALAYAPIVPLAIGTWPLLRTMGLDASKNDKDNAKAKLIYIGMSKKDLLESVGEPREKYSCIHKLHLKDTPDVSTEIWVYDDNKVLRGGRTLFIDLETGTVSYNSFHTNFFKNSDSFTCSQLAMP